MAQQKPGQNRNNIKRLYLADDDKKLAGVCGGIAEYFAFDSSLVRLAWLLVTIITGLVPGILAYIVAAIVVPNKSNA